MNTGGGAAKDRADHTDEKKGGGWGGGVLIAEFMRRVGKGGAGHMRMVKISLQKVSFSLITISRSIEPCRERFITITENRGPIVNTGGRQSLFIIHPSFLLYV